MPSQLQISLGQYSDRGRKEINQDFHGARIPSDLQLVEKGIAIAVADGISSSSVSRVASEAAVKGFLDDYFCTSSAWSVKKSVQRVLIAINSWLYAQTRQSQYRYDADRGYVCTLTALVLKSRTAHIFHVGDSRVYRLRGIDLEQLTEDHRLWVSQERSYLSRALGIDSQLDIDYRSVPVELGDVFVLATDGVHEFLSSSAINAVLARHPAQLDVAAQSLVEQALASGSNDNLTVQVLRIDDLPDQAADEIHQLLTELPLPPELSPRMSFDGYLIVRELHASSRSHVFLATEEDTGAAIVLKTPSVDLQADSTYLERFLTEDWIARRVDSVHVVKPCVQTRKRNYLYTVTEFIDGQTLAQWMIDHPRPSLETVRGIVEQIARGLMAFHRLEMLHQDLRPANVMIDRIGTVKIVDFGSTRVAGILETSSGASANDLLGTAQYTAPEYFLGEAGTARSDLFSLGVMTYQMLSGRLPYGAEISRSRTRTAQRRLIYRTVLADDREIPAWFDEVLRKATHWDPNKRYEELSEFLYDLRHPNEEWLRRKRQPLIERHPVAFWKAVSFVLLIIAVLLASQL
jgi:serine/threonine protein phosphatase PrpC